MPPVTGLTAARMAEIEAASIVDGNVVGDDLILVRHDASTINAGNVRGATGLPGDSIVPVGGTTGQMLTKASDDDHDLLWSTFTRAVAVGGNNLTTTYTLGLSDADDVVIMINTSAATVVIPPNASAAFPIGTRITIVQGAAGAVTIGATAPSIVTFPAPNTSTLAGVGAAVDLLKLSTDSWVLIGNGNLATSDGWQTFTPDVNATGTDPTLGDANKDGRYCINSIGMVSGFATVRWGPTSTQGTGFYLFKLPEDAYNVEPLGFSPIGSASIGSDVAPAGTHKHGLLHIDGDTPTLNYGLMAQHDGTFGGPAYIDGDVQNCHWVFNYEKDH